VSCTDNNSDSAGSGDEDDDGDGEDSRTDTSSQDSRKSIPSEFDLQLSIIVFKHVLDSYLSAAPKFTANHVHTCVIVILVICVNIIFSCFEG
jgi:hypothetical protein